MRFMQTESVLQSKNRSGPAKNRFSVALVHKILSIIEILTSIKDHNSVENEQKILFNHPNLHLVNINASTKFDRNPQINSQDIEHN